MNIYVNGDEHLCGDENMSIHLSNMFNAQLTNDAVEDSTVDQILQRTRKHIESCKLNNNLPDLMIIGFTDWDREEWFANGLYQNCNTLNQDSPRYQYYKDYIASNDRFVGAIAKYYNNVIYNLHSELFCLGVPHLFFNCTTSLQCNRDMMKFDWAEFYLKPYQISFNYRNWCRYKGFTPVIPGKFQYSAEANSAWAKLLYDHIQQYNLLTKDEYGSLYNLGRQRRRHYGPGVGEWDEEFLQPPSV